MNEQRDKFLTEVMGGCWHKFELVPKNFDDGLRESDECCLCGEEKPVGKPLDFSKWTGFGKLWEWATRQDWWRDFCYKLWDDRVAYGVTNSCRLICKNSVHNDIINPERFADAIYEFLTSMH